MIFGITSPGQQMDYPTGGVLVNHDTTFRLFQLVLTSPRSGEWIPSRGIAKQGNFIVGTKDFETVQLGQQDTELLKGFNERADRWAKETAIYSAPGPLYFHPDYMAIIGKGMENPTAIIPLILKRISIHGGDWFFALEKITGENPARECDDYKTAFKVWLEWAKQHRFLKGNDALLAA